MRRLGKPGVGGEMFQSGFEPGQGATLFSSSISPGSNGNDESEANSRGVSSYTSLLDEDRPHLPYQDSFAIRPTIAPPLPQI
jgi:hypothetical protein